MYMSAFFPYLIAFFAVCSYASLPPLAKKSLSEDITGFQLIVLNSIFLALLGLIAIIFTDKDFSAFKNLTADLWFWALLWAGLNFLGFALYLYAIDRMPVVNYQIMFLTMPVIGSTLAYFLLSETISLKQVIGGIIVAIGVYIAIKK